MKNGGTCLIFGGNSKEYEVSLRSAYSVLSALKSTNIAPLVIGITREGKWYLYKGEYEHILNGTWQDGPCLPVSIDFSNRCFVIQNCNYIPDIIFPLMHGENYEDGRIQGLFEMLGLKYVGADSFSSFLCFNKHLTKQVARALEIPVAKEILITKNSLNDFFDIVCRVHEASLPVIVKPSGAGSSFGVSCVRKMGDLYQAARSALECSEYALIEEYIDGAECEIGALEIGNTLVLSEVGKIKHGKELYDYDTKYASCTVEYEIPAKIDDIARNKIMVYARRLFYALGCRSLARFDFFVSGKDVIFNEVNTMPGFTNSSMYPMLFEHSGILNSELIKYILENNY